jgi:hypothetical protein
MATKTVRKKLANGEVREYVYEDYHLALRTKQAVQKRKPTTGLVYFIRAESGPIKIGFTFDFPRRFLNLQNSNHERLYPIAVFVADSGLERRLKFMFKRFNIRGEWFSDAPHIRREIDELKKTIRQAVDFDEAADRFRLEKVSSFAQKKSD